jgi:hypothetical protein
MDEASYTSLLSSIRVILTKYGSPFTPRPPSFDEIPSFSKTIKKKVQLAFTKGVLIHINPEKLEYIK